MKKELCKRTQPALFRFGLMVTVVGFSVLFAPACKRLQSIVVARPFHTEMKRIVSEYNFPGMTAAYALEDGTVRVFAVGLSDREQRIPMGINSRMLAASIGKTFTAATALALSADGILDMDDPIRKYVGNEEWFARLPNGERITTRHLLTHSSGIADHVHSVRFATELRRQIRGERGPIPPRELVSFILNRPAHFKPGTGFRYSDTGHIIAGLIVEGASGRDSPAGLRGGVMNRRDKQREETYAQILQIGEDLFATKGYEYPSIQQRAKACGLTKGALYRHFESKEALLEQTCKNHYQYLLTAPRPQMELKEVHWFARIGLILRAIRQANEARRAMAGEYVRARRAADGQLRQRLAHDDREFHLQVIAPVLAEARERKEASFAGSAEIIAVFPKPSRSWPACLRAAR